MSDKLQFVDGTRQAKACRTSTDPAPKSKRVHSFRSRGGTREMASNKSNQAKTYCYDYPRPALTVDIALFHRLGNRIDVLLIKRGRNPFKGQWAFPGGFVEKNESLEAAAARELLEETGLSHIDLEQIGA